MIFLKRDFEKKFHEIFYNIKKNYIIETFDSIDRCDHKNYKFSEKIIEKLIENNNISKNCYSLQYYLYRSEICIPINNEISKIINAAIVVMSTEITENKISIFELKSFQERFNIKKIQIDFFDINLYSNYALKLGYSRSAEQLFKDGFAALFIDFKAESYFWYDGPFEITRFGINAEIYIFITFTQFYFF